MDYGAIFLISLLSAFVQATVGFGYSLLFTPVAALLIAPADAIGASIVASTVGSVFYYVEYRPRASVRSIAPLAVAGVVTAPLGLWLLVVADEVTLRALIGLAVLASAILNFRQRGEPHPRREERLHWQLGVGALSGVMRGAVSLSGPPVILYQHWVGGGAQEIRSRMFAFFLWTGVPTVFMAWGGRVLSGEAWVYAVAAILGLVPGIALGRLARPRVTELAFTRLSMGLLALTATLAILGALQEAFL